MDKQNCSRSIDYNGLLTLITYSPFAHSSNIWTWEFDMQKKSSFVYPTAKEILENNHGKVWPDITNRACNRAGLSNCRTNLFTKIIDGRLRGSKLQCKVMKFQGRFKGNKYMRPARVRKYMIHALFIIKRRDERLCTNRRSHQYPSSIGWW
jgi:hypothetical protein